MLTIMFFMVVETKADFKLQFTMLSHGGRISCANTSQLSAKVVPFIKSLDLKHWAVLHTTRAADTKGLPATNLLELERCPYVWARQ